VTDDGDMRHHTENEPSRLTENGLIARAKTRLNQTGVAVVISYAVNFRGEGLLAHVVVSKYVDHLPLRRLEGIFARQGIDLPRSTLCGCVADVPAAVTPAQGRTA
jgi:hypothetical protein